MFLRYNVPTGVGRCSLSLELVARACAPARLGWHAEPSSPAPQRWIEISRGELRSTTPLASTTCCGPCMLAPADVPHVVASYHTQLSAPSSSRRCAWLPPPRLSPTHTVTSARPAVSSAVTTFRIWLGFEPDGVKSSCESHAPVAARMQQSWLSVDACRRLRGWGRDSSNVGARRVVVSLKQKIFTAWVSVLDPRDAGRHHSARRASTRRRHGHLRAVGRLAGYRGGRPHR